MLFQRALGISRIIHVFKICLHCKLQTPVISRQILSVKQWTDISRGPEIPVIPKGKCCDKFILINDK